MLYYPAVLFKFTIRLRRLGQCDEKALKDKTIFTEKRSYVSRRSLLNTREKKVFK